MAPYLRADVHALGLDHTATVGRLGSLEQKVEQMLTTLATIDIQVAAIQSHMPQVLNAIASTNGTARILVRDVSSLRQEVVALSETACSARDVSSLRQEVAALSETACSVRAEMHPHISTIAWLLSRVETVRAEFLHELRYGKERDATPMEPRVINPGAITDDLRLNIGAGHIPMAGYVNVDVRELPGIDVVGPASALPFEPGTVREIFSSHTLEHFPELELRRTLLPYWFSLLVPGGIIRMIVPDLDAMTKAYAAGTIPFERLRSVTYGGQEYEGDFHYTGFTPASLAAVLTRCGFEHVEVIEEGRPNGDCLEFEMIATRPAG